MRITSWISDLDLPDWRYSLGLFGAVMLFVWHPFSGGARAPSAILFLLGLSIWVTAWKTLLEDQTQRRWLFITACLAIPNLLSLPTSYSVEHTVSRLGLILLMWVVGSVLIEVLRKPNALKVWNTVLAITVAVWVIDGLVQMFLGFDLLGIPKAMVGTEARVVGFYGNHLYLPWSLTLGLPLLIWMLLPERPYLALLMLGLSGVVIVGTGVRSGLLAWSIVAFFSIIYIKARLKWVLVTALVIALAVVIAVSPLASKRFQQTQLDEFSFEQINSLLSARVYLWETAWHMVKDRPLVGVGGDAFRTAYENYSTRTEDPFTSKGTDGVQNAHHLYLSVMAETGLLGLTGVLLAIGAVVRWVLTGSGIQRLNVRPYAIGLLAVIFPFNSQPLLYKTWWAPLLVLFVAALLVSMNDEHQTELIRD